MSTRTKRVEEMMTHAIRGAFLYEIDDPRLKGIDVTKVSITPDLKLAYVHFLLSGPGVSRDAKREREVMAGFQKVTSFLRRRVSEKVVLKYVPELRFFYDEGLEKELRIAQLLSDIKSET